MSDHEPMDMLAERSEDGEEELSVAEIRAVSGGQQESARLQVLRQCAEEDVEYQQLLHYVRDGFPDRRNMLQEGCMQFLGCSWTPLCG